MGADARASHTAFRRLMVHEATCNGSIQCLALLLELGEKFGQERRVPNLASTLHLPFLPRRIDRSQALAPIHVMAQHPALLLSGDGVKNGGQTDFVSMLRLFRQMSQEVAAGRISALDAFKNETECVSLLLRFNADANARAQPVSKFFSRQSFKK